MVQRNPYKHATRFGSVLLQPGECMTAIRQLKKELNSSEQKIRTALALLAKEQILTLKTTHTHTIITLTNWAKYQDSEIEPHTTQHSANTVPTQEQERKKERSITKPLASPFFQPCVDAYFAEYEKQTGTKPICQAKDFSALKALLKTGITLDQFKERLPIMFIDAFSAKRGWSLSHFCHNFQSFSKEAVNANRSGVRTDVAKNGVHGFSNPARTSGPAQPVSGFKSSGR